MSSYRLGNAIAFCSAKRRWQALASYHSGGKIPLSEISSICETRLCILLASATTPEATSAEGIDTLPSSRK